MFDKSVINDGYSIVKLLFKIILKKKTDGMHGGGIPIFQVGYDLYYHPKISQTPSENYMIK